MGTTYISFLRTGTGGGASLYMADPFGQVFSGSLVPTSIPLQARDPFESQVFNAQMTPSSIPLFGVDPFAVQVFSAQSIPTSIPLQALAP